jgi:prophage regulatory protein
MKKLSQQSSNADLVIPTQKTDWIQNPPHLDINRLLRLPDVLKLIPVSKSCWWSWVADNKAPPPVRLGMTTAWRYRDLLEFIEQGLKGGGES